ncbi:MAG: hypothetical protein RSC76_03725 [Oscillospiraceae bacterium]
MKLKKLTITVCVLVVLSGITWMFVLIPAGGFREIQSFAVDKEKKLYVGYDGVIDIYRESRYEARIQSVTTRGFSFSITDDQRLILATGTRLYEAYLNTAPDKIEFHLMATEKESDTSVLENKQFTDLYGNVFDLEKKGFRDEIVTYEGDNRVVLYKTPVAVVMNRILARVSMVLLVAALFLVLVVNREFCVAKRKEWGFVQRQSPFHKPWQQKK